MSCTCGSKSFLHSASCENIKERNKSVFAEMIELGNDPKPYILFYVGKEIHKTFDDFMRQLGPNFGYALGNENAATVSMGFGSEITFVTEIDHPDLLLLPKSYKIYLEKSDNTAEIIERLKGHTDKVIVIDPKTREPV